MKEIAIPVADAAKDFLKVLSLVEGNRDTAVLMREGKAVATLNPMPGISLTCAELAERWDGLPKIPVDEANAFADDLEGAHRDLPLPKPAWD
jgi:hypothetical protein